MGTEPRIRRRSLPSPSSPPSRLATVRSTRRPFQGHRLKAWGLSPTIIASTAVCGGVMRCRGRAKAARTKGSVTSLPGRRPREGGPVGSDDDVDAAPTGGAIERDVGHRAEVGSADGQPDRPPLVDYRRSCGGHRRRGAFTAMRKETTTQTREFAHASKSGPARHLPALRDSSTSTRRFAVQSVRFMASAPGEFRPPGKPTYRPDTA